MENNSFGKPLPLVAMIVVEISQIGFTTLSKAAFQSGVNQYVYIVYYDALGTLFLLPWLLSRWISGKTLPVTFSLLCRFFCLGLIGKCLFPLCNLTGLNYSSVTVAAAIDNLSPIFTSLLALAFRMERLDLSKLSDQIKALGTFVAVVGALVVTLYKGPDLLNTQGSPDTAPLMHPGQTSWPLGCLLITIGVLFQSLWSILQADTANSYPDEVALVFFYTFFGTIQNAAASLVLVEGRSPWQIHGRIEIIAIFYAALATNLFTNILVTWCLRKKGPVYVSMFSPLRVAIAAVMGFVFLNDGIYLGSVIGSAGIVVGFYAVIWGQAKMKSAVGKDIAAFESASSQVSPLLQT